MADLSLESYNEENATTVLEAVSGEDDFNGDVVLQLEVNPLQSHVIHGLKAIGVGGVGVYGESNTGVVGVGRETVGVLGHLAIPEEDLPDGFDKAGVLGAAYVKDNGSAGVIGESDVGYGVYGTSDSGIAGVRGDGDKNPGVMGSSVSSVGVVGTGSVGVEGRGEGAGVGVFGNVFEVGVAVVGQARGEPTQAWAGFFIGPVVVEGPFIVFGAPKFAAVPHRDGSHRLLYSMESPESWFEDFGEAKLTNGRAKVRLDPEFAGLVKTGSYHVFVTPYSNSNGLYVSNRTGKGFEVREQNGGKSKTRF